MIRIARTAVISTVFSAVVSASCAGNVRPPIRSGFKVAATCPFDGEPIPFDYLGAPPETSTAIVQRLNAYLRAAKASPLWCGASGDAYRALWIAANRPARFVTVTQQSSGWTAIGAIFQDPRRTNADHSAAVIDKHYRRDLLAAEVEDLIAAVANNDLWNAPAWQYSVETFDGDILLVELRAQGGYRVITRAKVTDARVHTVVKAILQAADVPTPRDN